MRWVNDRLDFCRFLMCLRGRSAPLKSPGYPPVMTVAASAVALHISYEGLLLTVQIIDNDEKVASSKTLTQ